MTSLKKNLSLVLSYKLPRIASSTSTFLNLFNTLLNASTELSACPFDLLWYGGIVILQLSTSCKISLISFTMNCVLLLDTVVSRTPNQAKSLCRDSTVIVDDNLLHLHILISTTIRYTRFNDTVKSVCTQDHGPSVLGQSDFAAREHSLQDFANFSISRSIFGQ